MDVFDKITVIIPSLNPDEKLLQVVSGLEETGFNDIIIVNDGSSPDKLGNFPSPSEHPSCTILTHDVNRGKGAALKTAFAYFLENRQERLGVVTVDGDNQHKAPDIKKCSEKMLESGDIVLGVRDFSLPCVPRRSRMGNRITSFAFRIGCGLKISDTQTGLRAFPRNSLKAMLEISGNRFEYETNMLLNMKNYDLSIREVPIETVYIEENQTSHFRPVRDSIRIYSLILKFVASSIFCTAVDQIVFYLALKLFGQKMGVAGNYLCVFIARVISSIINFTINKNTVFRKSGETLPTLLRYYAISITQMLLSATSVSLLSHLFGNTMPSFKTLLKIIIDTFLFFCSFRFQQNWVFAAHKRQNKEVNDEQ
ncbi:MAG: bifunctional glycosyltransferase family 2/GtrA family protein [Eubacteriales bacterium]